MKKVFINLGDGFVEYNEPIYYKLWGFYGYIFVDFHNKVWFSVADGDGKIELNEVTDCFQLSFE